MFTKRMFAAVAVSGLASLWAHSETPFTLQPHALGQYPLYQIQVDLNNDGIPDLLTSNYGNLTSMLSGPGGSFTLHPYGTPEISYTPLTSGDFNGDGKADVLFYDEAGGTKLFVIGYGDGKGNFTSVRTAPTVPGTTTGHGRYDIRAVAFDATDDGRPDVILSYYTGGVLTVELWSNTGSGLTDSGPVYTTTPANTGAMNTSGTQLLLGDYDADGIADVAVNFASGATVLYGNGTGHYTAVPVFANQTYGADMGAADMNEDGRTDLVAVKYDNTVHQFTALANRSFSDKVVASTQTVAAETYPPQLADFSGNGLKDIVFVTENGATTNNGYGMGFRVLYQSTPGVYTQGSYKNVDYFRISSVGEYPFTQLFTGDYNQDGKPDIDFLTTGTAYTDPQSAVIGVNAGTHPVGACPTTKTGIHVCSPGTTSSTSVPVSFSVSALFPVRKMEVWVDGVKRSETYRVFGTQGYFDGTYAVSAGSHKIDLFAVGFSHSMLYHTALSVTTN